ncbi:MAG TPA: hypothetical protein VG144_12060 [Gaiellaceae bacterium]|nr:hypothetical protein [Gaiellaceae bacterium]
MRAIALLLLPPLAALACVYAIALATRAPKPATPGSTATFVWKKQSFKNKRDFTTWLERRNVTYADWRARHPRASLPWEDEGIGREAVALLAAALAALLTALVRMRHTIGSAVERRLRRLLQRARARDVLPRAAPAAASSLQDAVAVYGVRAPPAAVRNGTERPELVLAAVQAPAARSEPPRRRKRRRVEPAPQQLVGAPEAPADPVKPAAPPPQPPGGPPVAADPEPEAPEPVAPQDAEPQDAEPEAAEPPEPEPAWMLPSAFGARRSAPPAYEVREVVCEIAYWRGYISGRFYAHFWGDAKHSAIATSPTFRSRSDVPEQTEESLAALATLTKELVADGWKPSGRGRAWYAQRFTNHVAFYEESGVM